MLILKNNPKKWFLSKIIILANGCWLLPNKPRPDGYVKLCLSNNKQEYAHILSYKIFTEKIPKHTLDHSCRNRACVNWEHLEDVTLRTNIARSNIQITTINKNKTHCPKNHEYTFKNTYTSLSGERHCRICHNDKTKNRKEINNLHRQINRLLKSL